MLWIVADTLPRPDSAGGAGENPSHQSWLPVDQIEVLLIEELGYEDQPEFEDTLRGSFLDFLDNNLLHATTKREGDRWVGTHTHPGAPSLNLGPLFYNTLNMAADGAVSKRVHTKRKHGRAGSCCSTYMWQLNWAGCGGCTV